MRDRALNAMAICILSPFQIEEHRKTMDHSRTSMFARACAHYRRFRDKHLHNIERNTYICTTCNVVAPATRIEAADR